jgi:hypothetical protein
MKKPKKKSDLFTAEAQEKSCMDYLSRQGYAVFKLEPYSDYEETEAVEKLKLLGYHIEHARDSLVKIDPTKVNSSDDIVLYFYELLKRIDKGLVDKKKFKDKRERAVDRSVINKLLQWHIQEHQISLRDALEDIFIMIGVLFDKMYDWRLKIRSVGILSCTTNKPLILSLLREVKLMKDSDLSFEVDKILQDDVNANYIRMLDESRVALQEVTELPKVRRKKLVHLGDK